MSRNENFKINLFYSRHKSEKVYNFTIPVPVIARGVV